MTGAGAQLVIAAFLAVAFVLVLVLAGASFGVGFRWAMEARRGSARRGLVPNTYGLGRDRARRKGVPAPQDQPRGVGLDDPRDGATPGLHRDGL